MEKDKTPSNDSANYYGGLEGMSAKQFLGAIVSMIVRIALAAVIIFGVFRLAGAPMKLVIKCLLIFRYRRGRAEQ